MQVERVVFPSPEDVDARDVLAPIREFVSLGRPVQDVMSEQQFHKIARDLLRLLGTRNP